MTFNLAEFLLNVENEYNGHKQTSLTHLPLEDGLKLCEDLERLTGYSFVIELWIDKSFSIYQKNYWPVGERFNGDVDRLILSVSEE